MEKSYVAALDLGDSMMRVAVASRNPNGVIAVEAFMHCPSKGVRQGKIENVEQAAASIRAILQAIEVNHSIKIESLHVGISGDFVRCSQYTDHVFVLQPMRAVSAEDVASLSERMENVQVPQNEMILERYPQNYITDGEPESLDPVGSFSRKLFATYNFISCDVEYVNRVELALEKSRVRADRFHSNAMSLCAAVTTEEERAEGVVVIDIGSQLTDLAICKNGVVRYTATVPIGGDKITADIASLSIPTRIAESLKCEQCTAVPDFVPERGAMEAEIPGRTAAEIGKVSLYNASLAIEAVLLTIIENVENEIVLSGYQGRISSIVLTGGSSRLMDIQEIFAARLGLATRLGAPVNGMEVQTMVNMSGFPEYATIIGVLLSGFNEPSTVEVVVPAQEPVFVEREPEPEPEPEPQKKREMQMPNVDKMKKTFDNALNKLKNMINPNDGDSTGMV